MFNEKFNYDSKKLATLDAAGKVPSSQLPSYVDDVEEYASASQFPATGEAGKIYVATDTNTTYRWSGTQYIIIGNPIVVDPAPVQGSTNAVSSGGVYTALGGKQDELTFDNTPTAGSTNPVTSDGIASVVATLNSNINGKQDTLTAGNAIDIDENNTISVDPSQLNARDIPAEGIGYKFAEGNPCVIYDGIAEDADDVTVTLEPIQDLHGYDRPWVGGAGKNLFDFDGWLQANNATYTKDGNVYTIDLVAGLFTNPYVFSDTDIATNFLGTITIPSGSSASYVGFELLAEDDTLVERRTPSWSNRSGCKVRLNWSSRDIITVEAPILTTADKSVTPFEPYSNICPITGRTQVEVVNSDSEDVEQASVTVQLGQTVYGGTLDVTTGELVVRTANIASYNGETIGEPWWSSMDEYVAGTTPTTGAQVVYTLANPIISTLTPAQLTLLEGTNILTTDGDKVTLKYLGSDASNVQRVLDNTFKAFAPVEQGIATANHAVGDYISFQTQFCKVTQAIAVGEIVQIGRNVQVTTVADELLAILAQINA